MAFAAYRDAVRFTGRPFQPTIVIVLINSGHGFKAYMGSSMLTGTESKEELDGILLRVYHMGYRFQNAAAAKLFGIEEKDFAS